MVRGNMDPNAEWIDVSVDLQPAMPVWPGDPLFSITRSAEILAGDPCNVSRLEMSAHAGTHMDAPIHFIDGARGIETMPIAATIGEARVIAIMDQRAITRDELIAHQLQPGERILFRTRNSDRNWPAQPFLEDFVAITTDAAMHLVDARVRTVGVDYLSVGAYPGGGPTTHRTLLGAGIWIIEGLNLAPLTAGRYEFICLPLRIPGSDGAPARAIARPIS